MKARAYICTFILLAATACSPAITVHGYVPTPEDLELIEPGIDTVFSIEERVGRPTNSALLHDSTWYYVQSTMEQIAYKAPKETDREVVVINFDEDGVVASVDRFGLENGQVINLNTRVTVADVGQRGILAQIFGNLLNFDAGAVFN